MRVCDVLDCDMSRLDDVVFRFDIYDEVNDSE